VSHPLLTRPLRRVVECLDEIGVPFFVDILGVLKTRRDAMDTAYLRRWAGDLGVGESLERALADAGLAS
jgi:hypothetical protein